MKKKKISQIYSMYNGYMLGLFLNSAWLNFTKKNNNYLIMRQRIQEFLVEINLHKEIPERQEEFEKKRNELMPDILFKIKSISETTYEFAYLGICSILTIYYQNEKNVTMEDKNSVESYIINILNKYDIKKETYYDFIIQVKKGNPFKDINNLLTPCLIFLNGIIKKQPKEKMLCFIAMPFHQPFASYYSSFYLPVLEDFKYQPFRAWGGISSEEYYDLLLTLIYKAGNFFADISGMSPNVMFEVGAAYAFNKNVVLISNSKKLKIPSNIGFGTVVFIYSTRKSNWQERAILLLRVQLAASHLGAYIKRNPEKYANLKAKFSGA